MANRARVSGCDHGPAGAAAEPGGRQRLSSPRRTVAGAAEGRSRLHVRRGPEPRGTRNGAAGGRSAPTAKGGGGGATLARRRHQAGFGVALASGRGPRPPEKPAASPPASREPVAATASSRLPAAVPPKAEIGATALAVPVPARRPTSPRAQRVVVLDAGHGGADPGAIGVSGIVREGHHAGRGARDQARPGADRPLQGAADPQRRPLHPAARPGRLRPPRQRRPVRLRARRIPSPGATFAAPPSTPSRTSPPTRKPPRWRRRRTRPTSSPASTSAARARRSPTSSSTWRSARP